MGVDVDVALKYAQKELGALEKKAPKIISSALNRTATKMSMVTKKAVKERYTVKSKKVTSAVKVRKANSNDLNISVYASEERIHIADFKITPRTMQHKKKKKKPITVEIIKGKKSKIYGFVATGNKSGKLIVFRRSKRKSTKHKRVLGGSNTELPIEAVVGLSIPEMMSQKKVYKKVQQEGSEMFSKRLEHEINRSLGVK